ncbi:cell surface protein [Listeria seeligeri]|uniref:cell surface protein n=1 Tax=Listeria seeligeri TaxID=1640 RepID=UPI0016280DE8|nr:cell surface protein [Listeria seeligeri]MBC1534285.1 cell surface protein [Listeria seeligeri]MBC1741168.1 cell surface protein [Listeria seeligeri]MBC1746811.1 cell surface protein [Listeria seeligeri]MBC1749531.1 cell surface protein [Listeria seeligeri]MBC1842257.1 cell surface protein [Listeria seeligeri]
MKKTTIGIMTLTASIIGITCFLTINTNAEKADTTEEKKIPTYSIQADYTVNVDNPNEVVGDSDYVFVGKVKSETGTTYKNKVPLEKEDGTVGYVGEAFTHYEVEVLSNLKNELVTNQVIPIDKQGGIREDGSAYDVFDDDQLPEAGKVYIFTAYTQDDGSLLVAGANSTISFDEKTKNIDSEKEVNKTEEVQLYEEAVDNQVMIDEDNLNSDFDASQEQQ